MHTLTELRDRVRERTDTENQANPSDAELTQLINSRYKEMFALLVAHGLHRAETRFDIAADGSAVYAMPSNFYAVLGVWRNDGGDTFTWLNRHSHMVLTNDTITGDAMTYRIVGASIEFDPRPASGDYVVRYIPVPTELSANADEIDGVLGWEEYVVVGAAIDVSAKLGYDFDHLERRLQALTMRLRSEANQAEQSSGAAIRNTQSGRSGRLPGGFIGVRGYWGNPSGF